MGQYDNPDRPGGQFGNGGQHDQARDPQHGGSNYGGLRGGPPQRGDDGPQGGYGSGQPGQGGRDYGRQGGWGRGGSRGTGGSQGTYGDQGGRGVFGGDDGQWDQGSYGNYDNYGGYGGEDRRGMRQQGDRDDGSYRGHRQGSPGEVQFDPDYHQWRSEQMRNLDDDYRNWRKDRYKKFSEEFTTWRNSRSGGSKGTPGSDSDGTSPGSSSMSSGKAK